MLFIILFLIFVVYIIKQKASYGSSSSPHSTQSSGDVEIENYSNSYQSKYLFSLNEKNEFRKLYSWANNNNLIVFPFNKYLLIT